MCLIEKQWKAFPTLKSFKENGEITLQGSEDRDKTQTNPQNQQNNYMPSTIKIKNNLRKTKHHMKLFKAVSNKKSPKNIENNHPYFVLAFPRMRSKNTNKNFMKPLVLMVLAVWKELPILLLYVDMKMKRSNITEHHEGFKIIISLLKIRMLSILSCLGWDESSMKSWTPPNVNWWKDI